MQNLSKPEIFKRGIFLFPVLIFIILLASGSSWSSLIRKNKVEFKADDGITITADNYFTNKTSPYLILFHQERSSRGEYDSIVERFVKIGYNCLVVDLRSGDKYGFVENETSRNLSDDVRPATVMESIKDVKASIEYAWNLNREKVILLGSASSASLALLEGKNNDMVKAVIALSPGEYFQPAVGMKSYLSGFPKKIFVGCSTNELPFVEEMFSDTDPSNITIFKPSYGTGERGSAALLRGGSNRDEYWLSLLIFFNSIK